jgi:hypothetical protein
MPRPVPRLPARYSRLSSGTKTFFAQDLDGGWWSAGYPDAMRLPSERLDWVDPGAQWLESPYFCVGELLTDGGLLQRDFVDRDVPEASWHGEPVVDLGAGFDPANRYYALTASRRVWEVTCPDGGLADVTP